MPNATTLAEMSGWEVVSPGPWPAALWVASEPGPQISPANPLDISARLGPCRGLTDLITKFARFACGTERVD